MDSNGFGYIYDYFTFTLIPLTHPHDTKMHSLQGQKNELTAPKKNSIELRPRLWAVWSSPLPKAFLFSGGVGGGGGLNGPHSISPGSARDFLAPMKVTGMIFSRHGGGSGGLLRSYSY